ncbi:hypothetical protein ZWY2020_037888 [Hordeum vulgare]|nr:hypothetical protein ZWY2020_037888 [Hordeum vulgare]
MAWVGRGGGGGVRERCSPSGGLAPALRLCAAFRCWALGRRWAGAAAAIASPNFVLSEHAFKCLGLGAGSDDEVEDGYGSDQEGPAVVEGDKDELAISRLGLPAQPIATEKCGITHLFPIQSGDLRFTKGFSGTIEGECIDGYDDNEASASGSGGNGEDVDRQQQHRPLPSAAMLGMLLEK